MNDSGVRKQRDEVIINEERNGRRSKFVRDEKPAVKTEQKAPWPTHFTWRSTSKFRYPCINLAKSAEVIKEASDLLDSGSEDNHSAYSFPFLTDDCRSPVPLLDFEFLEKKKKTRRRRLYSIGVSHERKDRRSLDPKDSSYTQSLEAEIERSELMTHSPVRSTGNVSHLTFSPIRQ